MWVKAYKEPYKPPASDWLQHAGEDLETQVFLVAETVGSTLDDTDLVVESLDEAERDLVLGAAGCRDVPSLVKVRAILAVHFS